MDKGMVVGYVRVSSVDQNEARQLDGVLADRLFVEHASGRDVNRPRLQEMLAYVREGDTVVVYSMDRLARNVEDLRCLVRGLTSRRISVRFVKENLVFTGEESPMAMLMLNLIGAVSEFERDLLRERQAEGIALAKKRGVYKGRKRALSEQAAIELRQRARTEGRTKLASEFGISRETLYRYLREGDGAPTESERGGGI